MATVQYGISVPGIVIDFSITTINNYVLLIGRASSVVIVLIIYERSWDAQRSALLNAGTAN